MSDIVDYEIIVSDDHSKDDSCEFIKSEYPDILLIEGEQNLGFSGNCNRGIKEAQKDLIMLLNSDVKLLDTYFKPCLKYFEQEKTFGVMGKVLDTNGKQQDGAKFPEISIIKIKGTINYYSDLPDDRWIPSFFLSGGNALIDRKKLIEFGGFNEIFNPYYAEDVELSIRAWRKGYRCYFEPRSECIHPISSTISKEKKDKVDIIRRRNRFIIHYLHLTKGRLLVWSIVNLIKLIFNLITGNKNYIKAYKDFLLLRKVLKKERRTLNKKSKLNLIEVRKEIISLIQPNSITKF